MWGHGWCARLDEFEYWIESKLLTSILRQIAWFGKRLFRQSTLFNKREQHHFFRQAWSSGVFFAPL